jgi:hypothetical protein
VNISPWYIFTWDWSLTFAGVAHKMILFFSYIRQNCHCRGVGLTSHSISEMMMMMMITWPCLVIVIMYNYNCVDDDNADDNDDDDNEGKNHDKST